MIWVSSIVRVCNVGGAGLMAKYGLPSVVPLVGRKESDDSIMGILGLALFVTSIAIRVTVVITSGTL
jgi:hypothetical protein